MRIILECEEVEPDEIIFDEIYIRLVGTKQEDRGQSITDFPVEKLTREGI